MLSLLSYFRYWHVLTVIVLTFLLINSPTVAEEIYGPSNLLKTMSTPFAVMSTTCKKEAGPGALSPIGVATALPALRHRSLAERLLPCQLFLPERMVLGQVAEFTVKAKPGKWVALAMADKNAGAKPIYGYNLRLGPDRKVVAIGKIPESGVLPLLVETPIEGDLIGEHFYFEAAIWSKDDMSDLEMASCVPSEAGAHDTNAVSVIAANEYKRGVKIVPSAAGNLMTQPGAMHGLSAQP